MPNFYLYSHSRVVRNIPMILYFYHENAESYVTTHKKHSHDISTMRTRERSDHPSLLFSLCETYKLITNIEVTTTRMMARDSNILKPLNLLQQSMIQHLLDFKTCLQILDSILQRLDSKSQILQFIISRSNIFNVCPVHVYFLC